jgi:hypothetical protein
VNSRFQNTEFEILVYWITARDQVRHCKEAGQPKPWTEDPLLRDYRWCNVRRMDDRVSRWLIEHWYNWRGGDEHQVTDAAYGRLINWPDALAEIEDCRNPADALPILQARADRGDKVFTGAYVVPGVPGKGKVASVMELIAAVAIRSEELAHLPTMRETWTALMQFDGLGSFLAGQIVADLAHLGVGSQWPDVNTWAPLGPGSARGINRLLGRPKDQAVSQDEFERLLPQLIAELRPRIAELWEDRRLQAMDVQNCLCEFDKYRRLTLREGKVRARYDGVAEPTQGALL